MANNKVILITGNKGEGKTTKLRGIARILKQEKIPVVGFLATAEINNGHRNTYKLSDINTGISNQLCSSIPQQNHQKIGKFYFNEETLKLGNSILNNIGNEKKVVIIDEIGPFELQEKLWHLPLLYQLNKTTNVVIISVRNSLVEDVIKKYSITNYRCYKVIDNDEEIINEIKQEMP